MQGMTASPRQNGLVGRRDYSAVASFGLTRAYSQRSATEEIMAARFVIGLFPSSGVALDAYHRLQTEGFPKRRLAHLVLQEVGPVPPSVESELEALQIDPLVWGDARHTFAQHIHNGETAVFVQVEDDDEAQSAAEILGLYAPLAVERKP
jgi:hypothetical protein